jgi:hypothetical protein
MFCAIDYAPNQHAEMQESAAPWKSGALAPRKMAFMGL